LDSKAVRTIVVFGVVATLLLTMMMIFTLDQVADTETPQIAADVAREFGPSLADGPEPPVRLTMSRDGKGVDARRVYKLVLRPSADVLAEKAAVATLMRNTSEFCATEIADGKGEVAIRCVAELADGATKESIYVKDGKGGATGLIHEVAELPPPAADATEPR
jgi:hypothetical protein